jgi:hypothetical protein
VEQETPQAGKNPNGVGEFREGIPARFGRLIFFEELQARVDERKQRAKESRQSNLTLERSHWTYRDFLSEQFLLEGTGSSLYVC